MAPAAAQPCKWILAEGSQTPIEPAWLTEMEAAGTVNGRPPPRKRLSELCPAEWQDFREALAIYRAGDKSQPASANSFFAMAAHHGNQSPETRSRLGSTVGAGDNICKCNHAVAVRDADPGTGPAPLFLLWHRAYIHAFELSLRSIMRYELADARKAKNEQAPDWEKFRLPYWDWSASDDKKTIGCRTLGAPASVQLRKAELRKINEMFAPQYIQPGVTNPFYEPSRHERFLGALKKDADVFEFKREANPFLTPRPLSFEQFNRTFYETWHQAVHTAVGSPKDGMANTDVAAQDPLFWVHHANIDRLWMAWVKESRAGGEHVPDLSQQWEDAAVRFPVRRNGVVSAYWPRYKDLSVNAEDSTLGYRYDSKDHFTGGPREIFKKATMDGHAAFSQCPKRDENSSCVTPSPLSRTVLFGRQEHVEVPASGALISVPLSDQQRDELTSIFERDKPDPNALYKSIYLGLQLSQQQHARRDSVSPAQQPVPIALQLYVIGEAPSGGNAGQSGDREFGFKHYLGSVDLFAPKAVLDASSEPAWQNFGFRGSWAAETLRPFVISNQKKSWNLAIAIVPVFRSPDEMKLVKDAVVIIDKIGLAGWSPKICPQLEDQCPLSTK